MKIVAVLFLTIAVFALHGNLFALAPGDDRVPPCADWTRADAAFYGKVLKVETAPKNEGFPDGAQKIRFQVIENFKGADNPTITIMYQLNSNFGFIRQSIKKGETWIIFAKNDIVNKSFTAFSIVKVDPKAPSETLETLKNIVAGKTSSAISGQITGLSNNGISLSEPVEIKIDGGGKSFAAKTDASGAFKIDVPDGNYKVELKFPYRAGLKWDADLLGTELVEGVPTIFRYDVRLDDGDCHFSLFDVEKK